MQNSIAVIIETLRYVQRANERDSDINNLKSQWAQEILKRLNMNLEIIGAPSRDDSLIFVGNHISYLDIPLLFNCADKLSFVAKQEISSWPVFGTAAKKIQTVFVKRESRESKQWARKAVQEALVSGRRIVIFPSGTTCLTESQAWKKGAFEIAHETGVRIQPFRIVYEPLRAVAYIGDDFFPTHLFNLFKQRKIKARIEFHPSVPVQDPKIDCLRWSNWSRGLLAISPAAV